MPMGPSLGAVIRSHKILLDTSFAMQPGFAMFLRAFDSNFRRNPILIPAVVLWELRKHCCDVHRKIAAGKAMEQISRLVRSRQAELRFEPCDQFMDLVILRVSLQHKLSHDIVVLTNDCKLMMDLHAMWNCRSVQSSHRLDVLKLHGRTQRLCFFEDRS